MQRLQRALSLIYPDQCLLCEALVTTTGGLCAACWRDTPFINGLVCDACGVPLPGQDAGAVLCDDCGALPRPWTRGRAVFAYRDVGRRIVLSLKHGDRTDLAPAAAKWMATAGAGLLADGPLLVPIPIHWTRRVTRRYNQAAELSRALARVTGLEHCPDALIRTRRTDKLDGKTVDQRFATLNDAVCAVEGRVKTVENRNVCLIDDVMTSGATLTVATNALLNAGAANVCVLVLARVEKAP